jgi:predicted O-linked N-acetylglucosamine transferase (SPINDLY family)
MSGGVQGKGPPPGYTPPPPQVLQALRQAWALHQQGQLSQAEMLYRDALKMQPDNPDALHFLGVLQSQQGRHADGLSLVDRAVAVNPRNAAAFYNRAGILREMARLEEALDSYDRALALKADHHGALNNRGAVLHDLKRYNEAIQSFDRAIAIRPDNSDAYSNRATTLVELGRFEEAREDFDRALAIAGDKPATQFGRGNALAGLGHLEEALAAYDTALSLTPYDSRILNNRGTLLVRMNRHEEAVDSFSRAVIADPNDAEACKNRGNALIHLRRASDALASFDQALGLRPGYAEALYGRAHALSELKRDEEAIAAYKVLLGMRPDHPYGLGMLLHAKRTACDWQDQPRIVADVTEGVREGRRVVTPLAFLAVSESEQDNAQCARILTGDRFKPSAQPLWRGERYRHDRIRLVYLSADFGAHAVATQIAGVFERHDRSRFETIAMSYRRDDKSEMRARLERAFDRFIDIEGKGDGEAAAQIRGLEADIVIDLTGLTDRCRPGILALRPAGLQVQHLGFAGTLGADYVDYVIADSIVIPQANQRHYTEKVVYLPDTYMPTDSGRAIAARPSRAEAGLPDKGFVFCAFNNSYKFSPDVFDIWMRLLKAIEGSVLWLPRMNDTTQRNLVREAETRGVQRERLVFAAYAPSGAEHLARLSLADLFLDTRSYNAHSSATDALWAGVPVLTQPTDTFAGRVGASVLNACGLPELIAESDSSYEGVALRLAQDQEALAEVKARLMGNRSTCALFDTARFTRHLEAAYSTMVENHRRGRQPESFSVPQTQS